MNSQTVFGALYCAGILVLLVGIIVRGGDIAAARLCQWSNAFFLLPVARALTFASQQPRRGRRAAEVVFPAAWGAAGVYFLTFAASTVHHGCLPQQALRSDLAAETLILLWLGVVLVIAVVFATTSQSARRVPDARPGWVAGGLAVALAGSVLLLMFGLFAVARGRMDGCLWPHESGSDALAAYNATTAPALARVWDIVDFVTAFSALVMAVLFVLQITDTLALGLFWAFAVLLIVLQLYRSFVPGGPGQGTIIAVVAVAGALFAACQLVVCCSYPPVLVANLLRRYDVVDLAASLLIGAAAITIFLVDNVPVMHSLWHVLGAAALYFTIESRYGGSWLFFGVRPSADSAKNTALL